jgi:hypothetical protein
MRLVMAMRGVLVLEVMVIPRHGRIRGRVVVHPSNSGTRSFRFARVGWIGGLIHQLIVVAERGMLRGRK